jgi:hypothetical protein
LDLRELISVQAAEEGSANLIQGPVTLKAAWSQDLFQATEVGSAAEAGEAEVQFSFDWEQIASQLAALQGEALQRDENLALLGVEESLVTGFPESYVASQVPVADGDEGLVVWLQ